MTTWNDIVMERWLHSADAAIVTSTEVWSGDELLHRAGGAAAWLSSLGFGAGEAVPALVDESPSAIALTVGATLSGRALAPLGTKLPASDLAHAVRGLGARAMVATPESIAIASAASDLAGVELHVLAAPPEPGDIPKVACSPDDVALIVHTSGTTGAPKPVLMRHRELAARVDVYGDAMAIGSGDRYSSASPFHHTGGVTMVYTVLGRGASIIPRAWFSIEGWREGGRLGVTHTLLVPTMIDMLLAEGALGDARPRVLQYGAAPIDPATLTAALRTLTDTRFVQIFGQTEVSPITVLSHDDHLLAANHHPDLLTSVGRPVRGVEVRAEHPDADGIGELAVRGPHTFVTDADGWRRTGDLGWIDAEGFVRLRGRINDRIVRGGENIYPVEVEQALSSHSSVLAVAVVGVHDRRWGEIVKAVVVPVDAANPPSLAELQAHARERIAHFKVPSVVEIIDELPRNSAGKVLRRSLIS